MLSLLLSIAPLGLMIYYQVHPLNIGTFCATLEADRTVQISNPVDPFWYPEAKITYTDDGNDYTADVTWTDCMEKHTMVDRYNVTVINTNDTKETIRHLNDFAAVYDGTTLNASIQILGSSVSSETVYFYIIDYDEYVNDNSPPHTYFKQIPVNTTDGAWTNFNQTYDNYGFYFYYYELPHGLNYTLNFSIDYVQLNSSGYNFPCSVSKGMANCLSLKSKQESVPGQNKQCLIAKCQTFTTERFHQLEVDIDVNHLNWIFYTTLPAAALLLIIGGILCCIMSIKCIT